MFCINTNEMSNNFIWAFFAAKGKYSTFTLKLHNGLLANSCMGPLWLTREIFNI